MILVFDTNILIDLSRKDQGTLERIKTLAKTYDDPAHITFPTYFEFMNGILRTKQQQKYLDFLSRFPLLNTSRVTGNLLASLKYKYDSMGKPIPFMDLFIAALVMEHNMILVTKDKDFGRIEEVQKIIL